MASIWKQKRGLFAGLLLGIILGAGGLIFISPPPEDGISATITTAGSTTVYPLSQEWAVYFHIDNPGLTVSPSTGGSGLGQSLAAEGLVDIGASSSYPKSDYIAENPHVEILPVSADALGIVANSLVNGTTLRLDCDMVVAIFQRNVTTWEDLENTFDIMIEQAGPINVYVRSDASGTTSTFARWLETAEENINSNGADYEWSLGHEEALSFPAGVNAVDGNPGVASGVENDPQAIGYVGLAFMSDLVSAQLYNPGNGEWVDANLENAVRAVPAELPDPGQDLMNSEIQGAYPIARLLFYLVNRENLHWYTLTYLTWCLVQGQKFVPTVGYVPINGTSAQSYSLSIIGNLSPSS